MEKKELLLPTIAELYDETGLETAKDVEKLNLILNQPPPDKWVKTHPTIANYRYLPIDKIEYLLRRIFKVYRIEITGQGTAFNGVWVTVRVHYQNPITQQMESHDGIGAEQLQTKKGASAADLANINHGAISMAFPKAKTAAVKDACDHFGKLFGCDLNRRDTLNFAMDENIVSAGGGTIDPEIQEQFDLITDIAGLIKYADGLPKTSTNGLAFKKAFNKRKLELTPKIN
jgi:hypothetical protein